MSYPIANNDIIEVVLQGRSEGQTTLTVLHYDASVTTGIPDGNAFLVQLTQDTEAGNNDLTGAYLNCCSNAFTLNAVTAQKIFPSRFTRVYRVFNAPQPGLINSPSLPAMNSIGVSKRSTGPAYRGAVGTIRMPGVAIASQTNGTLNAAGLTSYASWLTTVRSNLAVTGSTAQLIPVIYRRQQPAASQLVDSSSLNPDVRTQRTRLLGRGI